MAATAGTMIREAGPGEIREVVEVVARFPSAELVPDPQSREVEDLILDFEVDIAGTDQPCWVFVIPGEAWGEGKGGGFEFAGVQPIWLQALVIREGQLLADLTDRIREVEASLTPLDGGVWELRLEIGGEAAPVEQHAPAFSPIAGAATATVVVGNELETLAAGLREAEAVFGTVIPSD